MRVKSVSLVFHLALKKAGMAAQTAPARTLETNMQRITTPFGSLPPRRIMQAVVARQPISIWPSPPRFQQRIRKAGVMARETHRSIAMFWNRTQVRRALPKEPCQMVP